MRNQTNSSVELSVIVPVYNTGEFLPMCLDSILSQKDVDMEIIIVNDGSTDNSEQIIKTYTEKDNRIKYTYQANQGLSVARNTGLTLATGEYILFVDSDDWVQPDSLSYYCRLAHEKNVDVVIGIVNVYQENGSVGIWRYAAEFHNSQPVMSGPEYLSSIIRTRRFAPMVYTYFCRRSLLENAHLLFEPGLIHEDELWTPHMLLHAYSVTFGAIPHYAYRRRTSGSITSSTKQSVRLQSLIRIVDIMSQTYSRINYGNIAKYFFLFDTRAIYRTCVQIAIRGKSVDRCLFEHMHHLLPDAIHNDPIITAMFCMYIKHCVAS